jgi:hypothetical protein
MKVPLSLVVLFQEPFAGNVFLYIDSSTSSFFSIQYVNQVTYFWDVFPIIHEGMIFLIVFKTFQHNRVIDLNAIRQSMNCTNKICYLILCKIILKNSSQFNAYSLHKESGISISMYESV